MPGPVRSAGQRARSAFYGPILRRRSESTNIIKNTQNSTLRRKNPGGTPTGIETNSNGAGWCRPVYRRMTGMLFPEWKDQREPLNKFLIFSPIASQRMNVASWIEWTTR